MRWLVCVALTQCLFFIGTETRGQKLDSFFSKEDKVEYNGYTIVRSFEKDAVGFGESHTVLRRGKKKLGKIGGCCYEDSTRFALVPLLGNGRKQIVVEAYSGGGHCCTSYYIYDPGARWRTIFNGANYDADNVGYEMRLMDIDKDGVYEFSQRVMNFDYFYVSHAQSVFPEVIFAYDRRAGTYRPANRTFASYLLRDIKTKETTVRGLNECISSLSLVKNGSGPETTLADLNFRPAYYNAVAQVVLTYIFAGMNERAWKYFDENYRLRDKEQLRADLKHELRGSAIYRSLYKN